MVDGIKCPRCGSSDVARINIPSEAGSGPAKPAGSPHYKCVICGNHFSQSSPPASSQNA